MKTPRMCPICGTESIEPVVLDALLAVSFSGQPLSIPDLDAYRCGNGHLFVVPLGQRMPEHSDEHHPACSMFL